MNIGVVGAGLVGGSIARRSKELGHSVAVCDIREDLAPLLESEEIKFTDVPALLRDADFLFVCVPLAEMGRIAEGIREQSSILRARSTQLVITDVSSVKAGVSRHFDFLSAIPNVEFCPGHPMAGSELGGYEHSVSSLFSNATWVLCPRQTSLTGLVSLIQLVTSFGSKIACISEEEHDRVVASISHIPYVLSAVALLSLPGNNATDLALRIAASSFRDLTRVAGSPVELSAAMTELNHKSVLTQIREVIRELKCYEEALSMPKVDSEYLRQAFHDAQLLRRRYLALRGDRPQVDLVIPCEDAVVEMTSICSEGRLIHNVSLNESYVEVRCDAISH
jgi:prephenate dehydrogenase